MGTSLTALAVLLAAGFLGALLLLGRATPGRVRHLLAGALILLASLPLGIVLALVLLPLWRWLEQATGIEAVGHSGPAEWCYLASVLGCAALLGAAYAWRVVRKGRAPRRGSGEAM